MDLNIHPDLPQRLTTKYRDIVARQLMFGCEAVDLRGQIGEVNFKDWLANNCPSVPWEDLEVLMTGFLASPLADVIEQLYCEQEEHDQTEHPPGA